MCIMLFASNVAATKWQRGDRETVERVRVLYETARGHEGAGDWPTAEKVWSEVVRLAPDDARAWVNLGDDALWSRLSRTRQTASRREARGGNEKASAPRPLMHRASHFPKSNAPTDECQTHAPIRIERDEVGSLPFFD